MNLVHVPFGLMAAVLACTSAFLFQNAQGKVAWKPCGKFQERSFFEWKSMEMNPDPAVLGRWMSVTISGKTGELDYA